MAKKRIKTDKPLIIPIPDWQHVDAIVRRIGDLQLEIVGCEQKAKDKIDKAKAELAESVKPIQDKIQLHTHSIEAFAVNNRKDFGKSQSKKLNFGLLGWRKSTSISVKKTTLELVQKIFGRNHKKYIHVKETVNKEALKQLTDEQLASIAAQRKIKEAFFVEPELPEAVDYE